MIICCGEALIDMLPCETAEGGKGFAPHSGGAVFNTAVALGRLGAPVGLLSGISRDLFGEILVDALVASNVRTEALVRSDRPTTLAFVTLQDGQARYAFYDENTAGRMLAAEELPETAAQTYFFGGISLVAEPCGSAYEAMMAKVAPDHVTMLDPNIRPGFITDERAYRARITRMIGLADIVKLSDEDLHWLSGPGDTGTLVQEMLALGPKLICITRGAKGATGYSTRGDRVDVSAPRIKVADTVGAGDTFNAGILAALGTRSKAELARISPEDIETALSLGARAAGVTVSRVGANPPWKDDLV